MARILAIDYGRKRCGLAVTGPLQIVPGGVGNVRACDLIAWLRDYTQREEVELILIGYPKQMNGEDSESVTYIKPFLNQLSQALPNIPQRLVDERFTSVLAQRTIREAGIGKMRRQTDKELVDEVSAVIMLQSYLDSREAQTPLPPMPSFDITTNKKKIKR